MDCHYGHHAAPPQPIMVNTVGGRCGGCPECGGVVVNDYCTPSALLCGFIGCLFAFLPGLLCLWMFRGKRCEHCGKKYGLKRPFGC